MSTRTTPKNFNLLRDLMQSPLQLLDYRSNLLHYERLNPEPVPDDINFGVGLGIEFETGFDEEQGAQRIDLIVSFNEDAVREEIQPYIAHRGRFQVTGWLNWISEEVAARDDAERLLLVNGLSMLFGVARVYIADLTAGSGDRLMLPSITFKPIVDKSLGGESEDANSSNASSPTASSV